MAVYKVPQDVEAEDKLIGPFGFRQFIYIIIAAGAGFMSYLFYTLLPPLIIIPLPVMALFLLIALPLRKEQPMEAYVLALVRFYLKPKQRRWNPDGTVTYVEIVAPKAIEQNLSKEYGAETAQERIDYLARVMDSRGWALKGTTNPGANITIETMAEAEHAVDVFDEDAGIAQSFATMIAQNDQQRRQTALAQMRQKIQPAKAADGPTDDPIQAPHFDPYPSSMHQRVIQPIGAAQAAPAPQPPAPVAAAPAQSPAAPPTIVPPPTPAAAPPIPQTFSPDIMRLASNDDLSISAIANEAHRLRGGEDEVVIKLH